jgi:hypothetical protein
VTDELLARRILALEERVERVESTRPSGQELILESLSELRRDTADRLDRHDRRFDELTRIVTAGFEAMGKRFEAMDKRFEAMDKRFEAMDKRFEAMDERFEAMDERFEALTSLIRRPK